MTGRAGKAKGRNKNWYNIREASSEEQKSMNLDAVDWELMNDQQIVNLVMKQEQASGETTEAK